MNNRLLVKSSKYRIWPTPPDSEDEKKTKNKTALFEAQLFSSAKQISADV